MAMELAKKKWQVGFACSIAQNPRRTKIDGGSLVQLDHQIALANKRFGLPHDAPVVSCYEAGPDGFWLHRALANRQVDNLVVDSSSIEVDRRQRRAKTDRLDVGKLLRILIRRKVSRGQKGFTGSDPVYCFRVGLLKFAGVCSRLKTANRI